jgi:hypothetical protein
LNIGTAGRAGAPAAAIIVAASDVPQVKSSRLRCPFGRPVRPSSCPISTEMAVRDPSRQSRAGLDQIILEVVRGML